MELAPTGKIKQQRVTPVETPEGREVNSPNYTPPPNVVKNFHTRSDVDSSSSSQHHTLGVKRTQASQGNHNHDGVTSLKIAKGAGLTLTGSKGGNTALTNLINMLKPYVEFTDNTT
jgi:hypothetical protein